ncbi:hypothetical protein CEXT_563771 [Caerostris extrusa]|uniref:Uncharacterized protein n=1 Tax=Caerostris extrusa TaxID=172846 RepID=A0AAV4NWN8_CAEEX|nr:hypothetical protein CEXT_563771 [Caerostris extrusa]
MWIVIFDSGAKFSSRTLWYSFIHVKPTSTSNHNTQGETGSMWTIHPANQKGGRSKPRRNSSGRKFFNESPGEKIDTVGADDSFQRKREVEVIPCFHKTWK